MIIVNMTGQLGNQMFQYAIYRKLIHLGKNAKMDLRYYNKFPSHNGFSVFNLTVQEATSKEILEERDEYRTYLDRIRRKFLGRRNNIISEIDSKKYGYNSKLFSLKRGYIDGYWQSEKYFLDISEIIRNEFVFPAIDDEQNKGLIASINYTNSVSIHIRRGDYAGGFPMMEKEYYEQAIHHFVKKYKNLYFVVFSNDMEWAKKNIQFDDGVYVDWNTGIDSWKDMYLMSLCKHNIIANSSFSWWGAWLNNNDNKEVIAPKLWFYHAETPDIYCENWITI